LRMDALPKVLLDTNFMGSDCVVVKNGLRACGTGAVLANAPIVQDKSYWEVKVQATGNSNGSFWEKAVLFFRTSIKYTSTQSSSHTPASVARVFVMIDNIFRAPHLRNVGYRAGDARRGPQ
jgi:hypothetical protein